MPGSGLKVRQLREDGLSGPLTNEELSSIGGTPGVSEGIIVPAFTNAHSHLEYFSLMGRTALGDMGRFLDSIVALKREQSLEEVMISCRRAAALNRATGVERIWEHSDRPGSLQAMAEVSLSGIVQREVMDFFRSPFSREEAAGFEPVEGVSSFWGPHAPYSIRGETLAWLSESDLKLSIHCAESLAEVSLFANGTGGWEKWRLAEGYPPLPATGVTPVELLAEFGFLKPGRQLVHCCAVTDRDIDIMAEKGVSAAHCPRSNRNLACPVAPVKRLREAGVPVGIGLDSAASSGEIDFFAEMREAVTSSHWLGEPLSVADVWHMACYEGAAALGANAANGPWILIKGCRDLEEALLACPDQVEWLNEPT